MAALQIEVLISRPGTAQLLYSGAVPNRSGGSATDQLHVFTKKILITAGRSSVGASPLLAHNSTFHKQVIKGLCLYFIFNAVSGQIRTIRLTWLDRFYAVVNTQSIAKTDIAQLVRRSTDLSLLEQIDPIKATLLLEETPTGHSVLYAATHLIKSLDVASPFERFEKLWRAFNALYKAFAGCTRDFDCHVALAARIRANPGLFPLSIAKISPLTEDNIRSSIRWNQMILNNYATTARANALKDAILRVDDHRIIGIYSSSLPVREQHLRAAGHHAMVAAYIQNKIMANIRRDADVLVTLCIQYMYFVRNKIAHAERADHGFSFMHGSFDESEILWLTPFLEALVVDLINISDTF